MLLYPERQHKESMVTPANAITPSRAVPARSQKKLASFIAFVLLTILVIAGKNHEVFDPKSEIAQHFAPAMSFLIPHAIFAAIALLAALFQFSNRLRAKHPAFHRKLGYVYVACVFIGGPLGIAVASRVTPHALFCGAVIQSLGWMFCTAVALYSIRNGNIDDHRRWMIRGYAYAVVFTVARAIIPLPPVFKYGDIGVMVTVYVCIALAGFVPTIFLDWPKIQVRKTV